MNPFEHGEVFVTDDGGETDLDLGHYERFIDENLSAASTPRRAPSTGGAGAERQGDYLGVRFRSSRTSPTRSSVASAASPPTRSTS